METRLRARALAVGLSLGLGGLLALPACGNSEGGVALPSDRPSQERTATAEEEPPQPTRTRTTDPTKTTEPARTTEAERTTDPPRTTEPERTTDPPRTTEPERITEPPRTTEPERTTEPAAGPAATTTTTEPAATGSPVPAGSTSGTDDSLGPFGWLCLLLLPFAALAVALFASRSRRSTAWDNQAAALAAETRAVARTRLPAMLSTESSAERALAWPPLRDDMIRLGDGWAALAEGTTDEARRASATQLAMLIGDLVAAVDSENEALAAGRDWRLLRPAVDSAGQALTAALTVQPTPGQYPGGEPGPAGYPA